MTNQNNNFAMRNWYMPEEKPRLIDRVLRSESEKRPKKVYHTKFWVAFIALCVLDMLLLTALMAEFGWYA